MCPKKIDTKFGSFQTQRYHFLVVGVKISENQASTFDNFSHILNSIALLVKATLIFDPNFDPHF